MATITKTPSGTWKALIRRTGWPTTSKTFRTRRDGEDWARRTEDEMVRGVYIRRSQSERLTIAAALARYAKEVTPQKKESTRRREINRIGDLSAYFGKYSLAAVTPEKVAEFRDFRLAQGKANNTVRLELALLGHLYTVAIREWGIGLVYNPVANIRKPSPGAGRNRRLSPEEQDKLLAALDEYSNPFLGQIARIAIETGMRKSEIVGLRRRDVDLKRRIVTISDTKNNEQRTVPLTRAAVEVFRAALLHPIRPIDTDLIFFGEPGRDGKRRPYEFISAWNEIRSKVGMADLHFHDLRHEAVSRLVELGLSDQEVAAISGHKSMQMLRRYTHLRAEDLVERLDRLNQA
jgi:Site-specific recombinase XerD